MSNGIKSLKECLYGRKLRLSVVAIILGIMVLAPMVAAAGNPNPGVVPVNSNFHGKTYGEWSAEWWKWVLSIPADRNPLIMIKQENSLPKHNQEMCGSSLVAG